MTLYILGNGFDLAHKLPTAYWDFRTYLKSAHPEFLEAFEEHYDIYPSMSDEAKKEYLWNRFESNLANIDEDSLAELAPFATVVFTVSVEGKLGGRGQNLIGPLVEFFLRNGEGADVGASGLVDGHADGVDVVDAVEQLQRTEGIQLHLWVVVGFDQNASAVLVVHDVQRPVCDDDAVTGAEALLDVLGVVEPLFDQDHRVRAGFLGLLDQLHYEGHIPVGAFLHFGVVPSEVFGRVFCFHTECRPELELTVSVGVGTFGCEIAAFVVVAFTESCRRWAV